jgi:hypothetical protein
VAAGHLEDLSAFDGHDKHLVVGRPQRRNIAVELNSHILPVNSGWQFEPTRQPRFGSELEI